MLTLAIALLFTLTAIAAALAIVDSVLKARIAYAGLMREAAIMRAGFVMQVDAPALRVRRNGPARVTADRRSLVRAFPLPGCQRSACAA